MKREKLLAAACAAVLLAFFSFSLGVHWDAARWDTASRVGVERSDLPEPPVGTEPEPVPTAGAPDGTEAPVPVGQAGEKVNINTADKETLMTLPGVGETRAQAIVDEREQNGPFRHPEDITRVSGIGEGLMETMLDRITTEPESEDDR